MGTIRVMIVDDHPTIRHGLASILSVFPDLQVVGEAGDGCTALELSESCSPDIILLDIRLGSQNGVSVCGQLHKRLPDSRIIILTAYDNQEYVVGAVQAGASGYLLKNSAPEAIAEAIFQVHAGQRLVSPSLMHGVLEQLQDLVKKDSKNRFGLSEEDVKLLDLIAHGASAGSIGSQMYWGERTVRRRIEEVVSKLGAKNRSHAVAIAIKEGLL